MTVSGYEHRFSPALAAGAPPLLLLHGTGGDADDMLAFGRNLSPGSALLAPNGDVSEGGARRFFRRYAEGVFDLDDVRRRTNALGDFLVAAARRYRLEPGSLVAIGYSNGANIAASLLMLRPDVIGDAVLVRPMVVLEEPAPAETLVGRSVLILSGDRDPIVPPDHPGRLAALLRAGGAEVTVSGNAAAGHGLTAGDVASITHWLAARNRRG